MKVSREGVVLIKSFEGFRPRAVPRADGGWVIGYGHTASAREGLTVGEADAELLLQYDLIPVVRTLNQRIDPALNQHQFDALASFVFSIGVDRFTASDLLPRLNAGETAQVADALAAWADDAQADTPLRRRAAERALFIAAPGAPVALADLLAAPLPLVELTPAPPPMDRETAVAALLGEPLAETETPAETAEAEAEPEPTPAPKPALPTTGAFHLYSPYRVAAFGPLPGFPPSPAPPPVAEPDVPAEEAASEPAVEPVIEPINTPVFPQAASNFSPPVMRIETPTFAPAQAMSIEPVAEMQVADFAAAPADQTPPLVLTPLETAAPSPFERLAWPETARASDADEPVLFDEAAALEHLSIRNDADALPPRRFDWSETGLFLVMGGIGLVSFGAAMAAFRRASEVGGGDTAMIGWVLAVIALACVSVSGFNLYQRFGRADRD